MLIASKKARQRPSSADLGKTTFRSVDITIGVCFKSRYLQKSRRFSVYFLQMVHSLNELKVEFNLILFFVFAISAFSKILSNLLYHRYHPMSLHIFWYRYWLSSNAQTYDVSFIHQFLLSTLRIQWNYYSFVYNISNCSFFNYEFKKI